ncbi:hypothetical protein PFLUV_G00185350 [Perca fluviatilis]|uniref:DUF4585 domain-containing protein n=1 Tax=Perca fluviatilis TaxID=8168 RepID=A0A6A5EI82_PERFL|nr:hypothetical protein PFLUV_G00185350 [Perca fluviatilis]
MSSGLDGGGGEGRGGRGGRQLFLSSHRCPEVDLLPHHDSKTQIPPPRSIVPAERSHAGRSEQTYLSTCCSAGEEGEEGEGSISEWSEEDLSLHFSPSIILQSDDESDPESGFECVDVTVESQVKGPEGAGLKMVPKRLIQLKKKDAVNATEGGADGELSANELLRPRPDLLLRQHSMPAALPPSSSDVDGCSVYRGLVAAAPRGCNGGGDSAPRQRLQKSFSLDETKTKMASCIIKSILSKKMQVEQNSTSCLLPQRRLKISEENRSARPGPFIRTAGDWDCHGNTPTPATHGHHGNTPTPATHDHHGNTPKPAIHEQIRQLQQQAFLCFLPAQGGSDVTGSGALLRGPAPCGPAPCGLAPCHMMLDPQSGRCFYVDSAPPPQRKVLLDPETGQFFQVFLPADTNPGVFVMRCANSAPTMISPAPTMISPAPAVLSVLQFQPTVAMSSLYAPPCLAFTLHTPSAP